MATRERLDNRERNRRRNPQPHGKCTQPRERAPLEKAEQTLADPEQNPAEQEGKGSERQLKGKPEQPTRLKNSVERKTLSAQETLEKLLEAVGE